MANTSVRSYKMNTDCGFAPNPYGGVLTIATCKPLIREVAKCGEWIAGFTSKTLNKDPVGQERLIFLMRVTEKLHRDVYYERYPQKRPDKCPCGDNIYRPDGHGSYIHIGGIHHRPEKAQKDDHKSAWVLLSTEFYYFGGKPVCINETPLKIPRSQSPYGVITQGESAEAFIKFVRKYAADTYPGKSGMFEEPHTPCKLGCTSSCGCTKP